MQSVNKFCAAVTASTFPNATKDELIKLVTGDTSTIRVPDLLIDGVLPFVLEHRYSDSVIEFIVNSVIMPYGSPAVLAQYIQFVDGRKLIKYLTLEDNPNDSRSCSIY